MFNIQDGRGVRRFAAGLAVLSLIALIVTAYLLANVNREQEILQRLIVHLPESDLAVAEELSGDLNLQSSLSFLLVLNAVGTTIAFAVVVRGYVSSEQNLRDVKVYSTDILASMDAGVITTDRNGKMTSINPSGRNLLQCDDDFIGRPLSAIDEQHALLATICEEVGTYHHPIRDRDYVVHQNGHRKTLRAGCTLLRNRRSDEIGTVIHVRDVSEKALIEERLRRMERYMGLGSLAAGLQHEIKNPLSALSLHIQLLCERFATKDDDTEVTESLDVLHTEVKRINNVLDGFRNYATATQIGRSSVDVPMLIEKLVRLLRPEAEKRCVKLCVELPKEIVGLIQADSVGIEQVLLNLALNGMAAMPEGGVLTFSVSRQSDCVRIDVADTGNGIPPDIQSKIFDPYFTTRNEGTGMGLALCDKIIRQHDGSIDFQSTERTDQQAGRTVFSIRLPLQSS
ncbi:two-component system sensor histidine kinase NtrB [Neorhodopirellula pilleata]|uniref:histidine kinase n=1 Tax=Neorhodopirellula pilleata TaxID=2714738 RepID=A0A5C6AT29_9BACT|nr:ATP-binding protein [Neorhodopirellula pilleata]TWU03213.1 Sensor protein ZraS [Neorhodopirellula pilleata]